MIEELRKYKYIKKSKLELEMDNIVDGISRMIWNDNGYSTVYYLGAIHQLKVIAEFIKKYDTIDRDYILALINVHKTNDDVPDEIKNLVDMILDEFDYKE